MNLKELAGTWRELLRAKIAKKVESGDEIEIDCRFQAVMNFGVPSDAELVEMQRQGKLRSDEALARKRSRGWM